MSWQFLVKRKKFSWRIKAKQTSLDFAKQILHSFILSYFFALILVKLNWPGDIWLVFENNNEGKRNRDCKADVIGWRSGAAAVFD